MARGVAGRRLALATGILAVFAALVSDVAVWADEKGDGWGQLLAVVWIVTVLAYVLTPLVSRLAAHSPASERVLTTLGDVELVVTTHGGIDPALAAGERLLLRRRG